MRGRDSNLELLRIISMFLIILIHLCPAIEWNYLGGIMVAVCNMGVSCFILISGYFGMKFSLEKLLKLEVTLITLSLVETGLLCLVFPERMQGAELLEQLLKSLLPFLSRKYWFYSCYVCVFVFSNYIQKFIDGLSKQEFKRVILLLLLIFSVAPTLFYFEIMQDAGKGLIQMFMLYLIGRYIRMYQDVSINKKAAIAGFLLLWILNAISISHPIRIGSAIHSLCRDNSITNIAMAVILLYLFKDMKFSSKVINRITVNMFAVFALENSFVNIAAHFLEKNPLKDYSFSGLMLLMVFVGVIFISCILVGEVRNLLLGKIENKLIKVLCDKIHRINGVQYD